MNPHEKQVFSHRDKMDEEQKYQQYLKQEKVESVKKSVRKVIGFLILTNILPVLGLCIKVISIDGYKYTFLQAYITGVVVELSAFIIFSVFVLAMSLLDD